MFLITFSICSFRVFIKVYAITMFFEETIFLILKYLSNFVAPYLFNLLQSLLVDFHLPLELFTQNGCQHYISQRKQVNTNACSQYSLILHL